MNIKPALTHFDIHPTSLVAAMQDVRNYIVGEDKSGVQARGVKLFSALFETEFPMDAVAQRTIGSVDEWIVTIAQGAVEYAFKHGLTVDDDLKSEVVDAAVKRAEGIFYKPGNKWMSAVDTAPTTSGGELVQVSTEVAVSVEVKSDGKIKKGGKQVLADALYKKFLLDKAARGEGPEAGDNQEFIGILMREAQMTKAGATTYNYNCKKNLGLPAEVIAAAPARKA